MSIKALVPMSATVLLLAVAGCEVEKTSEGDLPDVDVSGDAGALPEYEVEQTQEGRMPDVDVDVEGGQLPEYDVDGPDVDIEEETVTVPTIDVDPAGENEVEDELERDE
jgi:hypothetical protein